MNKRATKNAKTKQATFHSLEEVRQRYLPTVEPVAKEREDITPLGVTLRLSAQRLNRERSPDSAQVQSI